MGFLAVRVTDHHVAVVICLFGSIVNHLPILFNLVTLLVLHPLLVAEVLLVSDREEWLSDVLYKVLSGHVLGRHLCGHGDVLVSGNDGFVYQVRRGKSGAIGRCGSCGGVRGHIGCKLQVARTDFLLGRLIYFYFIHACNL